MMPEEKQPSIRHYGDGTASVMRRAVVYGELRFYQRSDVLGQRETQRQIIARLEAENAALRQEIAALREKLAGHSGETG